MNNKSKQEMHAFIGVSKNESMWTWLNSRGPNRLKCVYWCCDALYRRDKRLSDDCSVHSKDDSCQSVGQRRHGVFTLHEVTESTHTHTPTAYPYIWMPRYTWSSDVIGLQRACTVSEFMCASFPFCRPDYSMSQWPLPAVTPSASNVWSAAWTTTPTALCAKRICLRYVHTRFCWVKYANRLNAVTFMWFLSASRLSNLRSYCSQFILSLI